jgi:hypothetical protein
MFNGNRVSVIEDEKVLEIDYTTTWIDLTVLNYSPQNGQDHKYLFYMCFTTIKNVGYREINPHGS